MTPLAAALLAILVAEADHSPLKADSLARVLYVTGFDSGGDPVPVADLETAIAELEAAGQVDRLWRRGVAHYRAARSVQAGHTKDGEPISRHG